MSKREWGDAEIEAEAKKAGVPLEEARIVTGVGKEITRLFQENQLTLAQGWSILLGLVASSIKDCDEPNRPALARHVLTALTAALTAQGWIEPDNREGRRDTRSMRRSRDRWKS